MILFTGPSIISWYSGFMPNIAQMLPWVHFALRIKIEVPVDNANNSVNNVIMGFTVVSY